ncbi:MAG TPA: hypothetical protein GXX29_07285 [Firmicutes bacterium]|nr:hypothetical protein [Bacillota bacterium]
MAVILFIGLLAAYSCPAAAAGAGVEAAPEARGKTYYLDGENREALNSLNYGTEDRPWKTIDFALANLKPGDTLLIKEGTYNTTRLMINGLKGTPEAWITIKAYPGHKVVLKGAGITTGRVQLYNCHYVVFQDIEITNFNQGLFIEGGSSNVIVDGVKVYDIGQEGIHVKGNSSHVVLQNCTVHHVGLYIYNGEGFYIGTGSAGPLDNTSYVTIRNNLIYYTTEEGIELKPGTHHCLVEGNTIYNVNHNYWDDIVGAIEIGPNKLGVQLWRDNPQHIIRDNTIHSVNIGIMVDTGSQIYNNNIYNVKKDGYGIYIDNSTGDNFPREVYQNTIVHTPAKAIYAENNSALIENNKVGLVFNTSGGSVEVEAEEVILDVEQFRAVSHAGASGGMAAQAIRETPQAELSKTGPGMEFTVKTDEAGWYYIWMLVSALDKGQDSAWISVNGGSYNAFPYPLVDSPDKFRWAKLAVIQVRNAGDTINIRVGAREMNGLIDKFIITNNVYYRWGD